jgi:hypothetical protein
MSEEYTEKIHAERLIKTLERKPHNYGGCPAAHECDGTYKVSRRWLKKPAPCKICMGFIGLDINKAESECPCSELGDVEAFKRSWITLEEKGYV